MPIYEYQCQVCQHQLEALQKISDAPLLDCPECGEPALKKKISAAAFRLKGGGWYETDFKTGNKKNLSGGEGGGDKPTAASSGESKSTESKSTESKTSDNKSSQTPASDSKKSDSKASDSKASDSKKSA